MIEERIVLVNEQGEPIGTAEKSATHTADTPLHLAFSCYIFNDAGQLLMTKRARSKKVWPGVWSNSCCGHPMPDETMQAAIERRVAYELGLHIQDVTVVLPTYQYKTPPFEGIIEHEFCPVFAARTTHDPVPNLLEVEDWRWMTWQEYCRQLVADEAGNNFSWWCKDQLRLLTTNPILQQFAAGK